MVFLYGTRWKDLLYVWIGVRTNYYIYAIHRSDIRYHSRIRKVDLGLCIVHINFFYIRLSENKAELN